MLIYETQNHEVHHQTGNEFWVYSPTALVGLFFDPARAIACANWHEANLPEPLITVHVGRTSWQGLASEAASARRF